MTTSVFQDVWSGWTNLVRELVGRKPTKQKTSDLKGPPKPRNRVALKRDMKEIRRPRAKRTNPATIEPKPDSRGLKREPVEDEPKLQVDPPKPFLIKKELLETPSERVRRIELGQKKKGKNEGEGGPLVTTAGYYSTQATPTLYEAWYEQDSGASRKLPPGWGLTQVGRAFRVPPRIR